MKISVNLKSQCDSLRKNPTDIYFITENSCTCTQQSYREGFVGAEADEKGLETGRGRVLWREDMMSVSHRWTQKGGRLKIR